MQNAYSRSTGHMPVGNMINANKEVEGTEAGLRVQAVGSLVLLYGLVLVISGNMVIGRSLDHQRPDSSRKGMLDINPAWQVKRVKVVAD